MELWCRIIDFCVATITPLFFVLPIYTISVIGHFKIIDLGITEFISPLPMWQVLNASNDHDKIEPMIVWTNVIFFHCCLKVSHCIKDSTKLYTCRCFAVYHVQIWAFLYFFAVGSYLLPTALIDDATVVLSSVSDSALDRAQLLNKLGEFIDRHSYAKKLETASQAIMARLLKLAKYNFLNFQITARFFGHISTDFCRCAIVVSGDNLRCNVDDSSGISWVFMCNVCEYLSEV